MNCTREALCLLKDVSWVLDPGTVPSILNLGVCSAVWYPSGRLRRRAGALRGAGGFRGVSGCREKLGAGTTGCPKVMEKASRLGLAER